MQFQKLFFSIMLVIAIGTDIFLIRQQLNPLRHGQPANQVRKVMTNKYDMDDSWKIIHFIKQ